MSSPRTTRRLAPDALGMKALITATSLAATLGGWAVLAIERPKAPVVEAPIAEAVAIESLAIGFELNLAPLPTIVAPPQIVIDPPLPAGAQRDASASAAPPPAVNPPLRVVGALPGPVARTRSSR